MGLLGTLGVKLTAATAKFVKDMKGAADAVESASSQITKLTAAATVGFAAGSVTVLKLVEAASDAAEQMNVLGIAFGENADSVVSWAAETSAVVGRSAADLKDYAGQIGALTSPTLGVTGATAKMSQNMALLAVDLGSVFNAMETDVLTALKAGLIGSAEPMMRFGVVMNVAALETFRLSKGIKTSVKDMSEGQKIGLRYAFIMERTAAFQGDAAKTAAGWANMTKRVQGQIKDLTIGLGRSLLPTAEKLAQLVSNLITWFFDLSDETKDLIVKVLAAGTALAGLVAVLGALALALPAIIGALPVIGTGILGLGMAAGVVMPVFDALRSSWLKNLATMLRAAVAWVGRLMKVLEPVVGLALIAPGVVPAVAGAQAAIGAAATLAEGLASLGDGIDSTVTGIKTTFADLTKAATATGDASGYAAVELLGVGDGAKSSAKQLKELAKPVSDLIPSLGDMDKALAAVTFGGAVGDPAQAFAPTGGAAVDLTPVAGEATAKIERSAATVMADVGQSAIQKLGEVGELAQSAMQGFAAGGPIGAIIGVIADLLMRTEGFGETVELLNEQLNMLVDAIGPLTKSGVVLTKMITEQLKPVFKQLKNLFEILNKSGLTPLNKAIGMLNQAIMPIIEIILTALAPIFEIFGIAMRGLAVVIGAIAIGIGWVINAVIDVVREILFVVAAIADVFGAGGEIRKFAKSLNDSRLDLDAMGKSLEQLATGAEATGGELASIPEEVGDSFTELESPINDLGKSAATAAVSFKQASAALFGVPQGFKVVAARFAAIATGGPGIGGAPGGATGAASIGGRVFTIGQVIVQSDDPIDMMEKIEEEAAWQNFTSDGTPINTPPDPGKR